MEHQGTKTIETERLILRKFTADDLSAIFHNWTSDEKVTELKPGTIPKIQIPEKSCKNAA